MADDPTCESSQSMKKIIEDIYKHSEKLDGYNVVSCTFEGEPCLLLYHKQLYNHPPLGPTSRCRISITTGEYIVHIVMREVERGSMLNSPIDTIEDICSRYSSFSLTHKFCPGIEPSKYDECREVIRFDPKSVRKMTTPFLRVDSTSCPMWFKIAKNASREKKEADAVLCRSCSRLKCDLERQVNRTQAESPSKRVKRQNSSSRARLMYMSPASQARRKHSAKIERDNRTRKLQRYEHTELPLDTKQDDEMSKIVTIIESECPDDLDKLFMEGEKHGVGHRMKEVWNADKRMEYNDFKSDQSHNRTGKRSNKWSYVTIRMALAVFTRSPAAYEALKSFNILQLPSRSMLQSYTGAFLHQPGANYECISEQVAQYILHCQERQKEGKKESQKAGVLIFDEVKVISRLLWNSRSQTVIGLAMSHVEQSSLADIYQMLSDDHIQQTSYILQFLWRDLTGNFDIIGPYFTCSRTLQSKFVFSCVLETVKLFHLHGLKTILIVCDGASTNLSTIKATHSQFGPYPIKTDQQDPLKVEPCMINPFDPPNLIYWLICPTHQLKNMINALFSSRQGGTKDFVINDVRFGWGDIISMYQRECNRVSKGLTRMVPKMKEVFVIRDAWTKLNVTPAKVMQQEHVLSELYRYIDENPQQEDVSSAKNTLKYLEACNKIFEKGFLCHLMITDMNSEVLRSIDDGFKFFTNWISQILEKNPNFATEYSSATQRCFLAWQTFDLLRIDVYGLQSFCKYFFSRYPGYFVSPLHLSGSAIESLFSQYKYSAGGKLDAANYSNARAANLIKQTVSSHHSGKGYRDGTLSTTSLPLKKKLYGKNSPN